jgi:hypothetical protein
MTICSMQFFSCAATYCNVFNTAWCAAMYMQDSERTCMIARTLLRSLTHETYTTEHNPLSLPILHSLINKAAAAT